MKGMGKVCFSVPLTSSKVLLPEGEECGVAFLHSTVKTKKVLFCFVLCSFIRTFAETIIRELCQTKKLYYFTVVM